MELLYVYNIQHLSLKSKYCPENELPWLSDSCFYLFYMLELLNQQLINSFLHLCVFLCFCWYTVFIHQYIVPHFLEMKMFLDWWSHTFYLILCVLKDFHQATHFFIYPLWNKVNTKSFSSGKTYKMCVHPQKRIWSLFLLLLLTAEETI